MRILSEDQVRDKARDILHEQSGSPPRCAQ